MGIIEKQSIQDIANAIRNRNGLTTLYKPREMDEAILNLYSTTKVNTMLDYILPCHEEEATDFTIKYADSDRPCSISELEGNTSQSGTPTPSSPIEVKTVSGDNEVLVRGKNFFDKTTVTNGYRLDGSGNASSSASNEFTSEYIAIAPNTTYIRSTGGVSAYTRTCFYDNSKTFISKDDSNQIITTPSNARYLRFSEYSSRLDTMQLEKRKCGNNL